MLISIYREKGIRGLFAGFIPRTLWITLGGAVFFGAYQAAVEFCSKFDVV
jgi:solute carrier family 25 S-adenosylmethionine transporter 26